MHAIVTYVNIYTGHTEGRAYKKIYSAVLGFFAALFGGKEALKREQERAQKEHPGATLDGLDQVAAREDDIGGLE